MRTCPQCKRGFPDHVLFCPDDGAPLLAPGSVVTPPAQVPRPSAAASSRPVAPSAPAPQPRAMQASAAHAQQSQAARTAPAPKGDGLIGRRLFGQYTITRKLGEGGMGAVYLAQQNAIDQKIAIKVLHAESAESDEVVLRFHREAQVISMLTHPNIIRVFIFGSTEDQLLYLAMEYVQGRDLRSAMHGKLLDELVVLKILKQMCSGLSESHDLGIIHRDLKPDNVLLTNFRGEENFVKILDFGIAKLKESGGRPEQKLTQAGIVYGTPEYLSPEQAQALELDQRTDIYSLGVMLYELMTGDVPFQGAAPVAILTSHVFDAPKPPSRVAPAGRVAPSMERLILKAMEKDPNRRFATAMEMFEALVAREMEILAERGLHVRSSYVPGMELTGIYHAVQLDQARTTHVPQAPPAPLGPSGPGRGGVDTRADVVDRVPPARPATEPLMREVAGTQRVAMEPPAGQADPTRRIMMALIVLAVLVLLALLGVIAMMLSRG